MMLTQSLTKGQKDTRRWLLLVGVVAFLVSFVLPTLLALIIQSPGWFRLLRVPPVSWPFALMILGMLLGFSLILALFTLFLWRCIVNRASNSLVGRGLLVFLLAAILAPIAFCLLSVLLTGRAIFGIGAESQGFLFLTLCGTAIAQALYGLPFLLIAGGVLGYLQGRALQRVA